MGRGRKPSSRGGSRGGRSEGIRSRPPPSAPKDFDPKDAKMRAITSYDDIADEVDDFHAQRDKVLLDSTDAVAQKDDDEYTEDEEEVFALDDSDTSSAEEEFDYEDDEQEDGSDEEEEEDRRAVALSKGRKGALSDDEEEEEESDVEGWGTSKANYYGADEITTEQDALDEEAEARRIQSKHLSAMSEADFLPDLDDWTAADTTRSNVQLVSSKKGGAVTEALPLVNPENLSAEERLKLLRTRNPEFEPLSKEFVHLQGLYESHKLSAAAAEAVGDADSSIAVAKFRALSAYLGVLAMYFAIFSSDGGVRVKEHGVMEGLVKCRSLWERVSKLESDDLAARLHQTSLAKRNEEEEEDDVDMEDADEDVSESEEERPIAVKKAKKSQEPAAKRIKLTEQPKLTAAQSAALEKRAARLAATEASLSDLSALIAKPSSSKSKPAKAKKATTADTSKRLLSLSDFADPTALTTSDAAEKSARKDALRFHASQLLSKSAKRTLASRHAGGDDDVPHKQRNQDRAKAVARANAMAGDDLDDASADEDDLALAKNVNNAVDEDLEYYNSVAAAAQQHKTGKKEAYDAAKAAAKVGALVVRKAEGELGADGKRAIGYTIEKNKGLTPHRKKDVRNPRVKKRKKYDAAKIKLASKKAIYKPLAGAYGGEATGIKKNLVKSVKLK